MREQREQEAREARLLEEMAPLMAEAVAIAAILFPPPQQFDGMGMVISRETTRRAFELVRQLASLGPAHLVRPTESGRNPHEQLASCHAQELSRDEHGRTTTMTTIVIEDGKSKSVTFNRTLPDPPCALCDGFGRVPDPDHRSNDDREYVACPLCTVPTAGAPTPEPDTRPWCGDCDGTGWVEGGPTLQSTCSRCGGSGREPDKCHFCGHASVYPYHTPTCQTAKFRPAGRRG